MSATFTVRADDGTIYVYVRGRLVMKRWPNGTSATFHVAPSGVHWSVPR